MLGLTLAFQVAALATVDDPIRLWQDILHYDIDITVPDTGSNITGRVAIRYVVGANPSALVLDLDRHLVVERVDVAGQLVSHRHEADSVVVDVVGAPGDTLEALIVYGGEPQDGLFIRRSARGVRAAFADNWPNRARFWIPTEDHPSDKASVSWTVRVPSGWRVVANGAFVGVDSTERGRTIWRYTEAQPIATYNFVIGAGRLVTHDVATTGVPQSLWTYPEDSVYAATGPFARVADIVETFTELVGAFPYPKLAHVQSSTQFGGMENAGAIFYAEQAFVRRSLGEPVVVHEIAHQWFGDAVTPHDWHHLWLSEGFATYFAALYYDLKGESGTYAERLRRMRAGYLGSAVVDRPILDFREPDYLALLNANNYQKGGLVLHMLRRRIGDAAFFDGLRSLYAEYRDKTVLTSDVRRVMEEASGADLRRFFEQWLTQPGYPMLDVVVRRVDDRRVRVDVAERQPEEWGRFELELPIDLLGEGPGERLRIAVPLSGVAASMTLTPAFDVRDAVVDPDGDVLAVARVRVER